MHYALFTVCTIYIIHNMITVHRIFVSKVSKNILFCSFSYKIVNLANELNSSESHCTCLDLFLKIVN